MKNFFILFSVTFLTSCPTKEEVLTTCNTNYPLEDLIWLKEIKNSMDKVDCSGKSTITQYTYNSNTVFEVVLCSNFKDGQTVVYNCNGEVICKFGGISGENTCPKFYNSATNKIILYGN
ncbi:MAG: DUF6970 domain-containing protein [Flavobacteriaceae bacterium]